MSSSDCIVQMRGINKTFPGVQALSNVDFALERGEIHAIVGENGAGKSTLIKVLTGVEKPNTGVITLDGEKPKLHAHIVVGRSDGGARGGHLLEGHVWPTLEVIVEELPKHLQRRTDPETGLALIDLDDRAHAA